MNNHDVYILKLLGSVALVILVFILGWLDAAEEGLFQRGSQNNNDYYYYGDPYNSRPYRSPF